MGVLSGGNFPDLLEPGLRSIFDIATSRPAPMMEALFGLVPSTKLEEHYLALGARGIIPVFDGSVKYRGLDAGYKKTIRNYEFADGIQIERQLVDDDQYNTINGRALRLGNSINITTEHDGAQVFVNAFTDGGTVRTGETTNGADGVALCSLVHPQSPVNTGSTQANEGTLALTLDNVDTTRQAMMELTDDVGELLGIMPDIILIPPELERTATQIFAERALYEPGSAQFDVNMFAGKIRPVVWARLTDANAWFLIDSALMKQHLHFQWRIRPEFAQARRDTDTFIAKYTSYMRYGIGWDDWRWIYGQNPS